MRPIGLDFGTTNSAIAVVTDTHDHEVVVTPPFRSILYFDPGPHAGPAAIERYLASDGSGRLVQSLKSHLASRLFEKTMISGHVFTLEDLVATLVRRLRDDAEARFGALDGRVVCGRPVRFVSGESEADDDFAVERLRRALALAGFEDVVFEYEPVGAAWHYESRLDHDELVLIADFGGGTSDFCLIRVGPSVRRRGRPGRRDDIVGTEGVALAGDAFDGAIVDRIVSPSLGMGSRYRLPLDRSGRTMEIPPWIYGKLRRWHHLSFLKSKETMDLLDDLRKQSLEPAKIAALIHVVEADLGFHLYRAVERCKVELSAQTKSTLDFEDDPANVHDDVMRPDFERWIGDPLTAIARTVDRLLERTNVSRRDVDRVFMTGGSSLVPSVRRVFAERFGEDRLSGGDELTSVALGLALRARDLDA